MKYSTRKVQNIKTGYFLSLKHRMYVQFNLKMLFHSTGALWNKREALVWRLYSVNRSLTITLWRGNMWDISKVVNDKRTRLLLNALKILNMMTLSIFTEYCKQTNKPTYKQTNTLNPKFRYLFTTTSQTRIQALYLIAWLTDWSNYWLIPETF